jgi:hypothetical protein
MGMNLQGYWKNKGGEGGEFVIPDELYFANRYWLSNYLPPQTEVYLDIPLKRFQYNGKRVFVSHTPPNAEEPTLWAERYVSCFYLPNVANAGAASLSVNGPNYPYNDYYRKIYPNPDDPGNPENYIISTDPLKVNCVVGFDMMGVAIGGYTGLVLPEKPDNADIIRDAAITDAPVSNETRSFITRISSAYDNAFTIPAQFIGGSAVMKMNGRYCASKSGESGPILRDGFDANKLDNVEPSLTAFFIGENTNPDILRFEQWPTKGDWAYFFPATKTVPQDLRRYVSGMAAQPGAYILGYDSRNPYTLYPKTSQAPGAAGQIGYVTRFSRTPNYNVYYYGDVVTPPENHGAEFQKSYKYCWFKLVTHIYDMKHWVTK